MITTLSRLSTWACATSRTPPLAAWGEVPCRTPTMTGPGPSSGTATPRGPTCRTCLDKVLHSCISNSTCLMFARLPDMEINRALGNHLQIPDKSAGSQKRSRLVKGAVQIADVFPSQALQGPRCKLTKQPCQINFQFQFSWKIQ